MCFTTSRACSVLAAVVWFVVFSQDTGGFVTFPQQAGVFAAFSHRRQLRLLYTLLKSSTFEAGFEIVVVLPICNEHPTLKTSSGW